MKRISLNIEDIFNIPTSEIYNPDGYKPITAVSIDSRNISKNSLFVAIKGERFDGHEFVKNAVDNGAKAVVVNKKSFKKLPNLEIPVITVEDTTIALGNLAKIWREKLPTKIIGITGSAGKTTTKEILALLLNEKFKVNKTLANNNNHIGVPLTLLSTNEKHEVLIAELGTNHFGEIEYTASIVKPDYALITNIGSSHLEFLKTKKGVLKEKIALFKAAAENNGTLFINNDDNLIVKSAENYANKITFALENEADVKGVISGSNEIENPIVEVSYKNKKLKIALPLFGSENVRNFIAAVAIAFKLGLTKQQIQNGIKKFKAVDKRLNIKEHKNFILIDDTYNANPESMKHSIEVLAGIQKYENKIAVLGDMFELGAGAEKLHKNLAKDLKKNEINEVYTIGSFMKLMNEELMNSKIVNRHFRTRKNLENFLRKKNFTGSAILLKGSRGMKMEQFIEAIKGEN